MKMILSTNVTITSIIVLFVGGVAAITQDYPAWCYILWSLAFVWLLASLIYHQILKRKRQHESDNWIDSYQRNNHRYPPLPDFLIPLAIGYEEGNPISREIQLRPMSDQFWNGLLLSQRAQLRQLVEWLGMNWDDYYEQMRRMLPKNLDLGKK